MLSIRTLEYALFTPLIVRNCNAGFILIRQIPQAFILSYLYTFYMYYHRGKIPSMTICTTPQ